MGFFLTTISGDRTPYAIPPVEQTGKEGKRFNFQDRGEEEEGEEETRKKFLKASQKLYQKRAVILVREIMNAHPLRLKETLSLKEAWKEIKKHQVQHFSIIKENGKMAGLLSQGELLQEMQKGEESSLQEILSGRTLCVEPTTALEEVVEVFFNEKIEAVPVVDESDQVVGILTQNDLLKTIIKISRSVSF